MWALPISYFLRVLHINLSSDCYEQSTSLSNIFDNFLTIVVAESFWESFRHEDAIIFIKVQGGDFGLVADFNDKWSPS